MTSDDLVRMAREVGLGSVICHDRIEGDRMWFKGEELQYEIERFAALVAAQVREECAKICENMNDGWASDDHLQCADAIRSKSQ